MASQLQLSDSDAEGSSVQPSKMPRTDMNIMQPMPKPMLDELSDSDHDGEDLTLVHTPVDPVEARLDIMPGLRDVGRDNPLKMAEVFAGCGALSEAMSARGFPTWSIDYAIGGENHDFSSTPTALALANDLRKYHYTHFAPPCNTFSMARYPKLRPGVQNNDLIPCEMYKLLVIVNL